MDATCDFIKHPASKHRFLCKGADSFTCNQLYPSDISDRYSIIEGQETNSFKVAMKNLSYSDAAVYWCGLNITQRSLTYVSLYQIMQLDVTGMRTFD